MMSVNVSLNVSMKNEINWMDQDTERKQEAPSIKIMIATNQQPSPVRVSVSLRVEYALENLKSNAEALSQTEENAAARVSINQM